MEKNPLRGTLAGKLSDAKTDKVPEQGGLRGTLAPNKAEPKVESKLRGSLVAGSETSVDATKAEGRTPSKEEIPNVESLASLVGRTLIQRDGGKRCLFRGVFESEIGSSKVKTARLIGSDNSRYSLNPEMFLTALTTEGGAWRLLDD